MKDTFTVYTILCRVCKKEYSSKYNFIVDAKFFLHKIFCIRSWKPKQQLFWGLLSWGLITGYANSKVVEMMFESGVREIHPFSIIGISRLISMFFFLCAILIRLGVFEDSQ